MRLGNFSILQSRAVCWSLCAMFLVLAAAWGLIAVCATKGQSDTEILLLRIVVALFGLLAIWFLILAVRLGKHKGKS